MARPSTRVEEQMSAREDRRAHDLSCVKSERKALNDLRAAQNELTHAEHDIERAEREVLAVHSLHGNEIVHNRVAGVVVEVRA